MCMKMVETIARFLSQPYDPRLKPWAVVSTVGKMQAKENANRLNVFFILGKHIFGNHVTLIQ